MDSEKIEEFFREFYEKEILAAAKQGKKFITVDFDSFDGHCHLIAEKLLNDPEAMLPDIEKAASEAIVLPEIEGAANFHVRFKNLPEHQTIRIRSLRSEHIGKFLCVDGVVKRASEVKPKIDVAEFECECGNKISIKQTEQLLKYPSGCDMCGNKRGFKLIGQKLFDSRWLAIEEPFEIASGEKPGQVTIYLKEDLTSPDMQRKCDPGNRIKVTGILKELPLKTKGGARKTQFDIFIEANHVEPMEIEWEEVDINREDEERIKALAADPDVYRKLIASLAPSIYGMEEVKEAILLQTMGGVQQKLPDGTKVRGDIHILLLGDPAVAKCVDGDTEVLLSNGQLMKIRDIADEELKKKSNPIDDGCYAVMNHDILSMNSNGKLDNKIANIIWKRSAPEYMYNVKTQTGREIIVTPTHPFFICDGIIASKKADEIKTEDFIAVPRTLKINPSDKLDIKIERSKARNASHINIPQRITPELSRILGYVIGDGYVQRTKTGFCIWLTNNNKNLIQDFSNSVKKTFGLDSTVRKPHKGKEAVDVYVSSIELGRFLEVLDKSILNKSCGKRVPQAIMRASDENVKDFIKAFFDCEATFSSKQTQIYCTSASKQLLKDVQMLLLRFGIISQIGHTISGCNGWKKKYFRLKITGSESVKNFIENIGFREKSAKFSFKKLHSNIDIIPSVKKLLKSVRIRNKLSQYDMGIPRTTYQHYEKGDRNPSRRDLRKITENLKQYIKSDEELAILDFLANSDIIWDKVIEKKKIKPKEKWVYDLQVNGTHNFVANGIFVHNSQLLKMVSHLIPRGKYVSGKGATGAGLTATVFRDEELMGGWVLEAGAMVLCHKGVICIDEFDKMNKDDQIAMHEALEQQSYHPNTEITLADGSKHKIGMFVDGLMERNKTKIIKGKDCEILPTNDISILTTDFSKIYPTKINRVSRHIAPERFVNITFSNGRSILVTPEHPVFVLDGTEIKTLPAESAKKDMFVPMPKNLPFSSLNGNLKKIEKAHFNEKEIMQPEKMTTELARVLGYYVSEGHSFVGERCKEIGFTNSDVFILGDMKSSMSDAFGMQPYSYERHPNIFINRYSSTQLHRFFEQNFPEMLEKARSKKAPDLILKCTNDIVKPFLSAAYLGDGFVDSERFGLSTTSLDLAKGYQELLLKLGIYSYIAEDRKQKAFKVVISGNESMKLFLENIVDAHDYRRDRIESFLKRSMNKNRQRGDFPYDFGFEIKKILSLLKIDDGYFQPSQKNGITEQTIGKYIDIIVERTSCMRKAIESERDMVKLRDSCKISQQDIEDIYGVKHQTISYIEKCKFHKRKDEIMGFIRVISQERIKTAEETCKMLEKFLNSDISWIRIRNAEAVENKGCKYVYDVTVEPSKSFISECLVLHNTISIAKASIIATLPAQVSVLAGANPKFSRFDVYRPLIEQTDIPDTLLSRFDLKFALRDVPDKEMDEKIASHILESRLNPEIRKPEISPEFLRKFIAYMRQNCHPKMTKETLERIKNFYVTMRGMYKGEDTVAITLRQNEALFRMTEASAKIRFSPVVEEQDAERAIRIMKFSLQQFGYDYETGKIDIDRTEGTSSSQRSKIRIFMDVIEALEKKIGKQIPKDDIMAEAEDRGLKGVDEMIQKLKSEGMLFEPKHNVIQKL